MHFDLDEAGRAWELGAKLRGLTTEGAAPMNWEEFKRRQLLRRARLQPARRRQIGFAATLALGLFGCIAIWSGSPSGDDLAGQRAGLGSMPVAAPLALVAWDEATARSAASELWLASLPEEPAIVRVGTRAAVTNLEDRIAWVDDTLTSMRAEGGEGARAFALQHERERLITSLVEVRYAETLAAGLP
jgi:hypothetical protein